MRTNCRGNIKILNNNSFYRAAEHSDTLKAALCPWISLWFVIHQKTMNHFYFTSVIWEQTWVLFQGVHSGKTMSLFGLIWEKPSIFHSRKRANLNFRSAGVVTLNLFTGRFSHINPNCLTHTPSFFPHYCDHPHPHPPTSPLSCQPFLSCVSRFLCWPSSLPVLSSYSILCFPAWLQHCVLHSLSCSTQTWHAYIHLNVVWQHCSDEVEICMLK